MMTLILILLLGSTALIFSGCSSEPKVVVKTVYIKSKCPKLQTLEVNTTKIVPLKLDYEVMK